jgi:type IV pilus assembly protein PilA
MRNYVKELQARRADGDKGFTLIELLVVVVIIGILIAIAIPLYLNYRKGAENKSAASDVRNAVSTVEQCYSDGSNTLPAAAGAITAAATGPLAITCGTGGGTINISSGNAIQIIPNTTNGTYVVKGTHVGNGKVYTYDSSAGGGIS